MISRKLTGSSRAITAAAVISQETWFFHHFGDKLIKEEGRVAQHSLDVYSRKDKRETTIFCTSSVFTAVSDSYGLSTFPRFALEQTRREHIQEALVQETVLNDVVAGPEQRGVLSVGRGVWYTTPPVEKVFCRALQNRKTPQVALIWS